MTGRGPWVLEIPAPGGQVWGSNKDHRVHWRARGRHRAAAKDATILATKAVRVPRLERVRIEVLVRIHGWRLAEPQNYPGGCTLKGVFDGLADDVIALPGSRRGVVASDHPNHMVIEPVRFGPLRRPRCPEVVLTLHELPPLTPGS